MREVTLTGHSHRSLSQVTLTGHTHRPHSQVTLTGHTHLADHVGPGELRLQGLVVRADEEESHIEVVIKLAAGLILGGLGERGGLEEWQERTVTHLVNLSLVQSNRHQPPGWDVSLRSCL